MTRREVLMTAAALVIPPVHTGWPVGTAPVYRLEGGQVWMPVLMSALRPGDVFKLVYSDGSEETFEAVGEPRHQHGDVYGIMAKAHTPPKA